MKAHAAEPVGTSHVAIRDMSCNCSKCLIDVTLTSCTGCNLHRVRKENTEEEEEEEDVFDDVADEENNDKDREWENVPAEVGVFISGVYENNLYIGKIIEKDSNDKEIQGELMEKSWKTK